MIVKPAISFLKNDSDAQLITRTQTIIDMTDANSAIYSTPAPTLATVQTAMQKFVTAVAAAADGGITLTAAKNTARAELTTLLRNLASYVQVTCNGSLNNLQLSGFPIQKPSNTPVGILPAPTNLTVNFGARSGTLDSKVNPVPGAAIYNWLLTASGQTTPLQTAQTTGARASFDGLTPGVVYQVQCNAVGSAGPSDWSDVVSQFAV